LQDVATEDLARLELWPDGSAITLEDQRPERRAAAKIIADRSGLSARTKPAGGAEYREDRRRVGIHIIHNQDAKGGVPPACAGVFRPCSSSFG
jgi:hypothetical protein